MRAAVARSRGATRGQRASLWRHTKGAGWGAARGASGGASGGTSGGAGRGTSGGAGRGGGGRGGGGAGAIAREPVASVGSPAVTDDPSSTRDHTATPRGYVPHCPATLPSLRRRSTTGRHRPQSRPLRAVQGSALKTMLELGRTLRLGSTTGRTVRGWRCARPRCAMQQRPRSSPPLLSRAWEVTMLERRARPPLPRRAWRGLSHRPRTGAAACALAASGAAATPTTCSKYWSAPLSLPDRACIFSPRDRHIGPSLCNQWPTDPFLSLAFHPLLFSLPLCRCGNLP